MTGKAGGLVEGSAASPRQVFQGLRCAGYKYVLGRPVRYYKGSLRIPEMANRTFYPAYEINWAKVL